MSSIIATMEHYPLLASVFLFVIGLSVGSFLNVIIYRLPQMIEAEDQDQEPPFNLSTPSSHCPCCQTPIRWYHNIPLLSYVLLRGQCPHCQMHISWQYPSVELIAGLVPLGCLYYFGLTPMGAASVLLCWGLLALTIIDLKHQLLPDLLTLGLLWSGLLVNCYAVFVPATEAITGAAIGYGIFWLIYQIHFHLTGREGMGYGDFKLLAALGAWFGIAALPSLIFVASISGAVIGIALMVKAKNTLQLVIPFGPFLALAALIHLFTAFDLGVWIHNILN